VEQGCLIFIKLRRCFPVLRRSVPSLRTCILTVFSSIFIDFVRTYLHLHSYSFAVPLQDKCKHMQASSETFYKTFSDLTEERVEYRQSYCETIRLVRESVCVPSQDHTQAAVCTRRFTTRRLQRCESLFGDRHLICVDPNVRSTAFV
jgi:hypothetical protein